MKVETDDAFVEGFEENVKTTIKKYNLLTPKDNVIVAVSGGKDSTTALYLLHKLGYNVEGMIIDQLLGEYSKKNLSNIKGFCSDNNIKLHVVQMKDEYGCSVCYMKSVLDSKGIRLNSCTICGTIRRAILNKRVRTLKKTKIATGHNLDDEVQTVFMNFIQGNMQQSARLGPQTGLKRHEKFVPRIKPLYFCLEKETERYSKIHKFPVVYDPCPCSLDSFRSEIKKMLNEIEEKHPGTKRSIIEGFARIAPLLKAKGSEGAINECSVCGEPSSKKTCKVCEIIGKIKNPKPN